MPDDVKRVASAPGTTLYRGAGLHPFRSGELASVPVEHADDLVKGEAIVLVSSVPVAKPAV